MHPPYLTTTAMSTNYGEQIANADTVPDGEVQTHDHVLPPLGYAKLIKSLDDVDKHPPASNLSEPLHVQVEASLQVFT